MNRLIRSTEIENVIKIFQQQKSPWPDDFTGNSIKLLEKSKDFSSSNSSKKLWKNTPKLILQDYPHPDTQSRKR